MNISSKLILPGSVLLPSLLRVTFIIDLWLTFEHIFVYSVMDNSKCYQTLYHQCYADSPNMWAINCIPTIYDNNIIL